MYLVDTDVISAGAPVKRRTPALLDWMERNSARLYLSAVTIAEIEDGIPRARREGASRKAALLAEWLNALLHLDAERVLPFDIAIAAIAKAHGLTILTRNQKHFTVFGIAAHDPFRALPR